jgi:AcrR family transcriptional regulator
MSGARENQKLRTRKDLLDAAGRLMREGKSPSFEEVAEAALVSRATAYRYFPGLDALMLEAALHVALPTPEALFGDDPSTDPLARLLRLDAATFEMLVANEPAMRTMLAQSLQNGGDTDAPRRQNRRSPLIAAALAPARDQFRPADRAALEHALAVIISIEALVVFKDVLQLSDAEAARARSFAIRALVDAARKD